MELQVGVKILLKNKVGKYLLVHRSKEKYPEVPNPWDIVGGRIDPGSSLMENLAREVNEETGLKMTGQPKLVAAQDILRIKGRHIVRLTYMGYADGAVSLCDEHDMHKWFTIEEMKAIKDLDKYFKEILDNNLVQ